MGELCVNLPIEGRQAPAFSREGRGMKSTGIVRRIDELGRIVLPAELRRTLDIGERETMEIFVEGTAVVLKKFRPTCIFCESAKDISVFKGKNICPKCLRELRGLGDR